MNITKLVHRATEFVIDPHTNLIRRLARRAYRHNNVAGYRKQLAYRSGNHSRVMGLFDATVSSCKYFAQRVQSANVLRERKVRVERKARRRTEWAEAV